MTETTQALQLKHDGNNDARYVTDITSRGPASRSGVLGLLCAGLIAVPITEYQLGAHLNFTYVPMYGKFSGFSDFIFHYDAYVVGGVGAITTRPIAVIDPDNRAFTWGSPKAAFNVGLGLRIFFNRWFAAVLEVRDYIFLDKLENTEAVVGAAASDLATWYGQNKLTNAIQAQIGVSIFLPFSWDYRLPK